MIMFAVTALLIAGILGGYGALPKASAATPPLASDASFAVLAYSGITNSGPTTITGNVGSYPTASETGFGSVTLHGSNGAVAQQQTDLAAAISAADGYAPSTIPTALDSQVLIGGVYTSASTAFTLSGGVLTLNGQGNSNSVWVFQAGDAIPGALTTITGSSVVLENGANSCNVFWVTGAGGAIIGATNTFVGTILAYSSVTLGTGTSVEGAALANTGDVTLLSNTISNTCVIASISSSSTSTTSTSTTSTSSTSTSSTSTTPYKGPQCDSGLYSGYYTTSGQTVLFNGLSYATALNLVTNNAPAAMSCEMINTPSNCASPASPVAVTINAETGTGAALTGFEALFNCTGVQTTQTGFTPAIFSVIPNVTHTVAVLDYGCYTFSHWADNGSTLRFRAFTVTSATTFTAVYVNSCAPLPATSSLVSVSATDTSGNALTGLYTTLWQNGALIQSCFGPCSLTVNNGQSYQVLVADFGNYAFSHWTDGTATRSYTVTVGSTSATIDLTAVYT
jgi:hypothetical protein